MVEPTESEDLAEMDRFCEAMIAIRGEIDQIVAGEFGQLDNPLKNAPHTQEACLVESWDRPYSRETAAMPATWLREAKFWPSVGRLDNAQGDRTLICSCPSIEFYT
jgi:glycine dehydrogenase